MTVATTAAGLSATAGSATAIAAGSGGRDNLTGSSGKDAIEHGGAGDDTITSGGGNDVISGGAGNDGITLGAGTTASVSRRRRLQPTPSPFSATWPRPKTSRRRC